MFWLIDSCQNSVSADQYRLTLSRAQVLTHWVRVFFWGYPLTSCYFSINAGSSSIFLKCIWNKSCSWAALLKCWFRIDLGRENSAGFYIYMQGRQSPWIIPAITFYFSHCHALITLYVQFLCSDWSKFDRWVHAENLCSVWKLAYW